MGLFAGEVLSGIFVVELRNLRRAAIALALESLFLVAIICTFAYQSGGGEAHLYWWAGMTFLVGVLLIPWLIWKYTGKVPVYEVKPRIRLIPSMIVMVIILPVTYWYIHTHLSPYFLEFLPPSYGSIGKAAGLNLPLGLTMLVLGLYVVITRRDLIKVVIGFVIMDNGIGWALVSPAPNVHEASAEIGLACNLVIATWLLLYLTIKIYEVWGTKDTKFLSELRW
jgi:hydrogenase-4 component E